MSAPPPEVPISSVEPVEAKPRRGVQAVTGDTFSFGEAVGGVRGVVETMLPGVVFVAVFVIARAVNPDAGAEGGGLTREFWWAVIASSAISLVALAVRLVQRTPIVQAAGGILGIAIGAVWAWRANTDAGFFLWGILLNAGYLVAVLASILVRWPAVGLFVEALRAGLTPDAAKKQAADGVNPFAAMVEWHKDRDLVHRYATATWFWVGMFAVRLVVQVPLYLNHSIGWLGTVRLVLGVPLWGLVLYLTWTVVRGAHEGAHEHDHDVEPDAETVEPAQG